MCFDECKMKPNLTFFIVLLQRTEYDRSRFLRSRIIHNLNMLVKFWHQSNSSHLLPFIRIRFYLTINTIQWYINKLNTIMNINGLTSLTWEHLMSEINIRRVTIKQNINSSYTRGHTRCQRRNIDFSSRVKALKQL